MARNKTVTWGKCLQIMKQLEIEKFVNDSICSSSLATSRSSLQEGTERDFS